MGWQDWILIVLLLFAGAFALSGLWIKRLPQDEKTQKNLATGQGVVGVLTLLWALYRFIAFITSWVGFYTIVYVLTVLIAIALGLLLGYKLIRKPAAVAGAGEAGDKVQAKLSRNQVALGCAGLAAAVLLFVLALGGPSAGVADSPRIPQQNTPTPGPAPGPMPTPAPTPQ